MMTGDTATVINSSLDDALIKKLVSDAARPARNQECTLCHLRCGSKGSLLRSIVVFLRLQLLALQLGMTCGNPVRQRVSSRLACELVTNALCHGDGQVQVRVRCAAGQLRVEVHDCGTGLPTRRKAIADDEAGRGLALLDGLIGLHGGQRGITEDGTGPGKTVHVVICLASDPRSAM